MVLGIKKKEIAGLKQQLADLKAENKLLRGIMSGTGIEDSPWYNLSLLSKALEINGIGFWVKENEPGVFWLSHAAKEMLGCLAESTLTWETFRNTILPEDRILFDKAIHVTTPGGKPVELELKIARHEGDGREFRILYFAIGRFTGMPDQGSAIMGTVKDITRQDKIKRDLIKAKERTEESEKLKNILIANILHEVRAPMNSIIGFSELLNIGNLPIEKRQEYVLTVKNQGIHLLKTIDDMIELTRMESGKITIRKSPCNIDILLHELTVIFNKYKIVENKDCLEIRASYPEKRGMVIFTDPGRLQQLISNLINNAIKFTERGWIEIGYRPVAEERIEFYIKDTGIGISRDLQKIIFNRFVADETLTGKLEGSGLGLTISKNLVRLLGGKIWVESETGKGSTFFFTIPHEEVPETFHTMASEEEIEIPSYSWKDKVILIVEDDEVNYKFLEAVLQDTAIQLLHARNGLQAVELCRTINKIDLVLMDLKMPEMDGFEATRKIREFNKKVPIIAQTAFFHDEELEKCREAGCDDEITKPIEIKVFFEKIDRFLKEK
ncbi:MAG TPA: ATP-binding protein [Bacteroidales bacterium]|nr:ATP-binding protein [Bacteroidales bacterium]